MAPMPPLIIEAPPLGESGRPGLFVAANGPTPIEPHAETSGAVWWSNACGGAHLYPPACADVAYPTMLKDAASGLENAYPVVVYASIECPAVGRSAEKAKQDVTDRLVASEQRAVEAALWGGEGTQLGVFQQLNTATQMTLIAGTAATAKAALGLLEQQSTLAGYDGPVLIHTRPGVAAYMAGSGLLRSRVSSDGEKIFTWYGSTVVFGAGYAGSSPDNVTAPDTTTEYMAATGRVLLGKSEIFYQDPPEALLSRVNNQRLIVAWRVYTVAVECFAAAVKFTRA